MGDLFGIPLPVLYGQVLLGLINGALYAMLSLGLALIFGLLNIINFAHGAFYALGAFLAWILLNWFGISYWAALLLVPIIMGCAAALFERFFLRRIATLDHLYGLLLTFSLALIIEGCLRQAFGVSGMPYSPPEQLQGALDLGFMMLPLYRGWLIGIALLTCVCVWLLFEGTRLGALLRAATERPAVVQAFGINVPLMVTLTYGFGAALAALTGVIAAPVLSVNPLMGSNLIIIVFAVVVIGGMGSILGAIITGFALGVIEGLTKLLYPEAANTVIFVLMAIVLLVRPRGLFGKGD